MDALKKSALILAILIIAALDILIYWNFHLYYKAQATDDSQEKIKILSKSVDFYPRFDLISSEKGRAYYDLALNNLTDKSSAGSYLEQSISNFRCSLKSNPASYFNHFSLGQSLLNLDYLFPNLNNNARAEYKKAAELAGENSQIYFEVAKIFLSRWPKLSDKDKGFTTDILRKIVATKDSKKFRSLLFLWEMNIKNYNIIENIMPEDPQIYRIYAEFLGEKSLSLQKRQEFLARAEFLEFKNIKKDYAKREYELAYHTSEKAFNYFKSCLSVLKQIKFYQNLTSKNLIDPSEFNEFKKSILLNLSKFLLQQGKSIEEVENYLLEYLRLENRESAIADLESYLKLRHIIAEKLEANFKDLNLFAFQLLLSFKKSRFREIIKIARQLQQSFVVIPKDKKAAYVRILQIMGDSFQKVDYIYDAEDFYQKALEIDPDNLGTLVRMRQNYKKLNAEEKIQKVDKEINRIISPREKFFKNTLIAKGRIFSRTMIFDGGEKVLDFNFDWNEKSAPKPLISIFFNGQVLWENYLTQKTISVPVKSKLENNVLQIMAVNRPVNITAIKWRPKGAPGS